MDEEVDISEKESSSESGYHGPLHDDVRLIIRETLTEYKEDRIRCLIDNRCKKMVLALFQKA